MTNSLTNEVGSLRQDDMGLQVEIVERSSVIVVTLTGPTDIAALEPLHDALQLAASERKDGRTRRWGTHSRQSLDKHHQRPWHSRGDSQTRGAISVRLVPAARRRDRGLHQRQCCH